MRCASDQPLDATVICVHNNRMVNLAVIDSEGNPFIRLSAHLKQDDDAMPEGMAYAEWMPYQVGAAKRDVLRAATIDAPAQAQSQQPSLLAAYPLHRLGEFWRYLNASGFSDPVINVDNIHITRVMVLAELDRRGDQPPTDNSHVAPGCEQFHP